MLNWLIHLSNTKSKNIWFMCTLDEKIDKNHHKNFIPQIIGSKMALEFLGIVDEVITMCEIPMLDEAPIRGFICHTINQLGVPAKDRSGKLDELEEANLGKLMLKIQNTQQIHL